MSVWKKRIDSNYLSQIENRIKTCEGRVKKSDWVNLRVGDTIIFYDNSRQVSTKVASIREFPNIEVAMNMFGDELLPLIDIDKRVDIYREIYGYQLEEYNFLVIQLTEVISFN